MALIMDQDPQSAADYDDRTTEAVRSVLLEIGQLLGSHRDRFAVIGGAVPWLLLDNQDMPHVGTLDVDLSLDAEALGDGEYTRLIEALMRNGYQQRVGELRRFQLERQITLDDGGDAVGVIVDFLMPRDAKIVKNKPPLIENFAVQRAFGADLALRFSRQVTISGRMPTGGNNQVTIAGASIPAFLAMKGFAITGRHKQKDAYDIYYSIRNYSDGLDALAAACRPLLDTQEGREGYGHIAGKFNAADGYGPTSVRRFVEESDKLGERTPEQWQMDAFGQVDAWLRAIGLR